MCCCVYPKLGRPILFKLTQNLFFCRVNTRELFLNVLKIQPCLAKIPKISHRFSVHLSKTGSCWAHSLGQTSKSGFKVEIATSKWSFRHKNNGNRTPQLILYQNWQGRVFCSPKRARCWLFFSIEVWVEAEQCSKIGDGSKPPFLGTTPKPHEVKRLNPKMCNTSDYI